MRCRASYAISIHILLAAAVATGALTGCHHATGAVMADTPLLPYKTPDIDDITGIDTDPAPVEDAPVSAPAKPGAK